MSRDQLARKIVVSASISRFSPSVWQRAFLKLAQSSPLVYLPLLFMGPHVNPGWGPCQLGEVSDWLLLVCQQGERSDWLLLVGQRLI